MAGPGGIEVGRANVRVLPNTSAFARSLERYLTRVERTLRVELPTGLDPAGIQGDLEKVRRETEAMPPARVPTTPDTDAFLAKLRSDARRIAAQVQLDIPATADGEKLRRDLAAKVSAVEKLSRVTVPADLGDAAKVRSDALVLIGEVEGLAAAAKPTIEIDVNLDKSKLTRAAGEAAKATSALTTISGQLSTGFASASASAATLGPPILLAASAATAMAPALAATIPAAFGAAAAAGALAVGFQGVGDALKYAGDPSKRAQFEQAMAGLAPSARATVQELLALRPALSQLRQDVQQAFFAGIAPLIDSIGTKLLPALSAGLSGTAGVLNTIAKSVLQFATSTQGVKLISDLFSGINTALAPLAGAVTPFLRAILQLGVAAVPGLVTLSQALAGVIERFAAFIDRTSQTGQLASTISGAVDLLIGFAGGVGDVLGPLISVLGTLAPVAVLVFSTIGQALAGALNVIADFSSGLAGALDGGALAERFAPLIDGVRGFIDSIRSAVTTVAPAIKGFIDAVLPTLINFGRQIIEVVGPALSDIGTIISTQVAPAFAAFLPVITPVVNFLLKTIGGALIGALKGAINVIKGVLVIISGLLNVFTGLFTGDWSRLWQGVKQILSGAWTAIKGIIQVALNLGVLKILGKGFSLIKSLFTGGWRLVVSLTKSAFSSAKTLVANGMTAVRIAVSSGISKVVGFFTRLPGRILGALGDLAGLLRGAGGDVIRGLLSGIRAAAGDVLTFMRRLAGDAVGAFKASLGINSPSRVFAELGRRIPQGLVVGVDAESSTAVDSIDRLAAAVVAPMSSAITDGLDSSLSVMSRVPRPRGSLQVHRPAPAVTAGGVTINGNVGWDPDEVAEKIETKRRDTVTINQLAGVI